MSLTKLTPPRIKSQIVQRAQLEDWIKSARQTRLVVFRAPAGFGKTTLMAQWLVRVKEMGRVTAWISLDKTDNDPNRFLANLIASIQHVVPEFVFDDIEHGQHTQSTNPTSIVLYLLEKLLAKSVPLTIFIDDFGVIDNPEVAVVLQQLIVGLPANMRFIISMRERPNLELGRLRASGEVIEVDAQGLRFDQQETTTFLQQTHGLELPAEEMDWLCNSTEGWIAAIHLYALSFKLNKGSRHSIKTIPGSFKQISDYLAEDVFTGQPEEIQSFLLQTSILEQLTGPLCSALTGRSDGAKVLEYLEEQNLFIVPLDEEGRWFRYHSLFRKFLRNRLERGLRDRIVCLHQIAAQWFLEHSDYQSAARHAFAADDIDAAVAILEDCGIVLVMTGGSATLIDLVERLPEDRICQSKTILISYCWALVLKNNFNKADKIIIQARKSHEQYDIAKVECDLLAIQGVVALAQDRANEAIHLSKQALSLSFGDDFVGKAPLLVMAALVNLSLGKPVEALQSAGQAERLAKENGDIGTEIASHYLVASYELLRGSLNATLATTRQALAEKVVGTLKYTPNTMAIVAVLAEVLYEKNELQEAQTLLTSYRSLLSSDTILPEVTLLGIRTLARINVAQGQTQKANSNLAELEKIGTYAGLPRLVASVRIERIRMALEAGDVEVALKMSREGNDAALWNAYDGHAMLGSETDTFKLCQIRLMIAHGQEKQALELLRKELKVAESTGLFRQGLKIRLLMVKAFNGSNQKRSALRALRDALLLSQDEGFIRSYVDEGPSIADLMLELRKSLGNSTKESEGDLSVEYLDRLLSAMGRSFELFAEQQPEEGMPRLEPLSVREIQVLEKLSLGLSNDEIADLCYISVNTVRFHLRNVNAKLGTKGRVEALNVARKIGAIP